MKTNVLKISIIALLTTSLTHAFTVNSVVKSAQQYTHNTCEIVKNSINNVKNLAVSNCKQVNDTVKASCLYTVRKLQNPKIAATVASIFTVGLIGITYKYIQKKKAQKLAINAVKSL